MGISRINHFTFRAGQAHRDEEQEQSCCQELHCETAGTQRRLRGFDVFVLLGLVPPMPLSRGCHREGAAERLPALPALCRCLPFSSFKAAPAALAPCSLICRATPRLPQPRRGRGERHPGGNIPHPRPERPGGSAGDGAAAPAPAQLGPSPAEEGCWGGRCACLYEWGCSWKTIRL